MIAAVFPYRTWRAAVPEPSAYFARKLVKLRKAQGLSSYRLAKLAGLTKQTLSVLESGERVPNWDTVQRLAKALGVDCREFENPELQLPEAQSPKKAGRPRKDQADVEAPPAESEPEKPPAPSTGKRKKKRDA